MFYMLIVGTFMCISMMCAKGSITGPRVKFVAELVRPSGLLFSIGLIIPYPYLNYDNFFAIFILHSEKCII